MNKTIKITLIIISGIVLCALIFTTGLLVGRTYFGINSFGLLKMNLAPASRQYTDRGCSILNNDNNKMSGYPSDGASNTKPLTLELAKQVIESYLNGINNPDLVLKEIMIFDNNAYARIIEKSTNIGAMELLVDPSSLSVYPEYGPNMMWNLKYGHMDGNSMMGRYGGMMGGYGNKPGSLSDPMTVSPDQALKYAQQFLDQQYPGFQTADDADPFYGYYTIDILKDGNPTGMLSVNGYNGQVFLHTWHGIFIEMWE